MRSKIALLVLCATGMLVVFGFLAFSYYAPHIVVAASSAPVLDSPAQLDSISVPSAGSASNSVDDAEDPILVPVQHIGRSCDGDSSASAGY